MSRTREGDLFCQGRSDYFGWMGFGGSVVQWHRHQRIGLAFIPTELHVDMVGRRGGNIQGAVNRAAFLATFVKSRLGAINSLAQVGIWSKYSHLSFDQELSGSEKSTLGDLINHNMRLAHNLYEVKLMI